MEYMFNALMRLLEKFTELAKAQQVAREKTLRVLITPMFKDLEMIHADYLRMLENCKTTLQAGASFSKVAGSLAQDRLNLEAVRRSNEAFAHCFAEDPRLTSYADFFTAIEGYLWGVCNHSESSTSSWLLETLDALNTEVKEGKLAAQEANTIAQKSVTRCLNFIREEWPKVCSEYAVLASKLL